MPQTEGRMVLCAVMNNNLLLLGDTEKYFKNQVAKSLNWISS